MIENIQQTALLIAVVLFVVISSTKYDSYHYLVAGLMLVSFWLSFAVLLGTTLIRIWQ